MEKIIVLFSVPLFLLFVLLIVVFVLANYSGNEQSAKPATGEVKAPDTTISNVKPAKSSPTVVKTLDTTEGENNIVTKE